MPLSCILQVLLVNESAAVEYSAIQLADTSSAVQKDIAFDMDHRHLFAITDKMVMPFGRVII